MTVFLDSPDAAGESFWRAVTGWTQPPERDAYVRVRVTGAPARTRLDLHVPGVPEAARQAVAIGAQVIRDDGDRKVLRSPVGLEFGLAPWRGETVRPPARQPSLLDQVCLDVPAAAFEAEASFWSALTGRERVALDPVEFERLPGLPVHILLQRIGSAQPGMHPDLACDDVPAEVARQAGLGAQVVRVAPGDWTTLRDPAGREYCVTARSPVPGFVGPG